MTNKTADELIVENAPKGWQFYAHILKDTYIKIDNLNNCKFWIDDGKGWKSVSLTTIYSDNWRSKSDIKQLVELRKKNAELESHNLGLTKTLVEFEQERAIRDLEQQAKGVEDALKFEKEQSNRMAFGGLSEFVLSKYANQLREQAKQLKDGAK